MGDHILTSHACELVQTENRAVHLLQYDEVGVANVQKDIGHLHDKIRAHSTKLDEQGFEETSEVSPEWITLFVGLKEAQLRNCRGLMLYQTSRLERIQEMCMVYGGSIPKEERQQLAPHEKDYEKQYGKLLRDYHAALFMPTDDGEAPPPEWDLGEHLEPPVPNKDLYIQVRACEDIGEIATSNSGTVTIKRGQKHCVDRSDVDLYIRTGKLTRPVGDAK
mmetsp:Transcript_11257/g.24871  ORF Transcript_11257/g.24871 Transcript_11257/m.24871 type:complete len:220 (-) Transcript_11257:131-790(-)|eukprot:CAMPEP_0204391616 /NCGR_PEP_ID=MMETSP0469-20131031/61337_1 /ASSEMBLY_ACC=CAM_ASM_000384 /TAXON_ID=2969 /ORGANISM="Oxyrrhis marina" /LENGTH=219 /DNA_ID=CAMNT_0051385573 /DNA_START=25 /DNA_END=684 /DNA_ORIENTATION=-